MEGNRAAFCGNILVRRIRRRSFLRKPVFEGVFGVLTDEAFEYYGSSAPWTNGEKPLVSIDLNHIQAVEEVDHKTFGKATCFQIVYLSHSKKDDTRRTIYFSAHDLDEFNSWLTSLRCACAENPVCLAFYHPGRFAGSNWTCCATVSFKQSPGCKPCTSCGLPELRNKRIQLSSAIPFRGFSVVACQSYSSSHPGSLPFQEGDHLTITDASSKLEWKAFSTTSTSDFGIVPKEYVALLELEDEPWFFGEIPTAIATTILRNLNPGCFFLRTKSFGSRTVISFRTETTIKHVEITFDESSQKFRLKDESDSVSFANFLQFESIQELLDQCKRRPTLGLTLDKYPTLKNVGEIWKVDWAEITSSEEQVSDLPWGVLAGRFHEKDVLVHILPEGSSDILKEQFTNEGKLIMTLNHENVASLLGVGMKGTRNFFIHEFLPKGELNAYLERNASLLLLHPSELMSITNQVLNGMVYLEGSGIVHGELVAKNCLVGENGSIKISGFHCSRSPWCTKPLSFEGYINKVPIPPPETNSGEGTSKSDTWAFGLLVYIILTAGQQPITSVDQVVTFGNIGNTAEQLRDFQEILPSCLRAVPEVRPTLHRIRECIHVPVLNSTPSGSTHSLEGSSAPQTLMDDDVFLESSKEAKLRRRSEYILGRRSTMEWDESVDLWRRTSSLGCSEVNFMDRLKAAELEALKAKALQKRAEAEKSRILQQIQEAEAKCLKEVEMITKTFLFRLNEANDRATESERALYLANELKRLTEEKFILYKYESERTIQDLQNMLEDTLLERDELIAALKTVGKDFEKKTRGLSTRRRTDSLQELESKYERYISTSDKTIQSLKEQLNGVVKQRDRLVDERESVFAEANQTKAALDQASKEKTEFGVKLEESHYERERLRETIATMIQKRQQVERERDQLQLLSDMSLMKLRQAESEMPRRRMSLCSTPSLDDDKEIRVKSKSKPDPNLRRLSEHLLDLMPPATKKGNKSIDSEDNISLGENSTPADSKEARDKSTLLQNYETTIVMSHDSAPTSETESESDVSDLSPQRFIHVNYLHLTGTSGSSANHSPSETPTTYVDEYGVDDEIQYIVRRETYPTSSLMTHAIPTVHIEEADESGGDEESNELPEIEITLVDENDNGQSEEYVTEDDMDGQAELITGRAGIGETRMVYDVSGSEQLIAQTCL